MDFRLRSTYLRVSNGAGEIVAYGTLTARYGSSGATTEQGTVTATEYLAPGTNLLAALIQRMVTQVFETLPGVGLARISSVTTLQLRRVH